MPDQPTLPVLDAVFDAILTIDHEGLIVYANRAVRDLFGHDPERLLGQPVETLLPVAFRAAHRGHRQRYGHQPQARPMGQGQPLTALRADGTTFPAQISLVPMAAASGPVVTAVVRDVSVEEARRHSEQHLTLSQEVAGLGSWELDHRTGTEYWSQGMYHLLGYPPDAVRPDPQARLAGVHPADAGALDAEFARARADGGQFAARIRLRKAVTAEELTVVVLGHVELDQAGDPVRSFGVVQDVTAVVLLERRLRDSDERFQAAFDHAPTGMALLDARPGRPPTVLMANQALAAMAGVPAPQLLGRLGTDLVQPIRPAQQTEGSSPAHPVEGRLLRPDGEERRVSMSAALMRAPDQTPQYHITHVVDVTARHHAEQRTRQQALRDARIAAVLQDGLMPFVPRRVGPVRIASRYRAAGDGEAVGGDWTDVVALPGGRIGLVVGDVAGHGIESAATMSRLRVLVRMLATSGHSPAGVMRRLNDVMHGSDIGTDITVATLIHGQLDPATGLLTYCSAGHLPLLSLPSVRPDQPWTAAFVPSTGGPPIGVLPDHIYVEQTVALEPGGRLVGYTDGLIERRGDDLDHSLLRLLTSVGRLPEQVVSDVEALADAVLHLSGSEAANDDVAVIVLGFEPSQRGCRTRGDHAEHAARSEPYSAHADH